MQLALPQSIISALWKTLDWSWDKGNTTHARLYRKGMTCYSLEPIGIGGEIYTATLVRQIYIYSY